MDFLLAVWNFVSGPYGASIGFGLWIISEALASIPSVQANSLFQLAHGFLSRFKKPTTAAVLLLLLVTGCKHASGDISAVEKVVAKVAADGKTVLIAGCKDLPAFEAVASVAIPLIPGAAPIAGLVTVVEVDAAAVCAKVLAATAAK